MKVARYHATRKRIAVLSIAPAAFNDRPQNISHESGAQRSRLGGIRILAKTSGQMLDWSFACQACHDFLMPTLVGQVNDA